MTIHAYYLLADTEPWDDNYDISETALDLELSNNLDCIDYIFLDDEVDDTPCIAY
tara:strand:- start:350 stop:514 length:165 start_codon:yes stop_codon:yes gene_type:complete